MDSELDALVKDAAAGGGRGHVGLVVAAFRGDVVAVAGAGVTSDGGTPPGLDTVFQIGSITKVFTSLALADAVARGALSLDTPLASLLPVSPGSRTEAIQLVHLATHTSGLPRLPRGLRRQALRHRHDPYRDFRTDDLLAALSVARPRRRPGTAVRYSNFGAALLGEALSRHAGMGYEDLVARRITDPLGLQDTVVRVRPDQLDRCAAGHSRHRRPVPDWDMGSMAGAGGLYSTASDLVTFLRAHLDPPPSLAEAFRLLQQPRARVNRWVRAAMGWRLIAHRGGPHAALWHNGGTGGFAGHVSLLPQARAGVVVLTNTARPVDTIGLGLLHKLAPAKTAPEVELEGRAV